VAVARKADPEGAGRAKYLIVGGTRESRGVVCSASYEARAFGVRSAMPISRALRLCPQATCVPVPGKACGEMSRAIRDVLGRFAPVVEAASVDEWYLDLTGTERLYHEPLAETARRMRTTVKEETELSISLGGGPSRLVAKLAVEHAKPGRGLVDDGVFTVAADGVAEFMSGVRLAEIPMVGPRFQERLGALGLHTVPDVLRQDMRALRVWLGDRAAEWLWRRVRGIDDTPVEVRAGARSISRDETFPRDLTADEELERELLALMTRAAADLRGQALAARTVTVRIRDHDFTTRQASRTLVSPVVSDRVLMATARPLLRRLRSARRVPARLLGVGLSSLAPDRDADQLTLFELGDRRFTEDARDRALARAVDAVRERFGDEGIVPARLSRGGRRQDSPAAEKRARRRGGG
jgi:DNA polymerase-4